MLSSVWVCTVIAVQSDQFWQMLTYVHVTHTPLKIQNLPSPQKTAWSPSNHSLSPPLLKATTVLTSLTTG